MKITVCALFVAYFSLPTFLPAQNFVANVDSLSGVKCRGTATGSAYISVSGGSGPYLFRPDNDTAAYTSGAFIDFFAAGNHFVVVIDALGAVDTAFFTIGEPDPFGFMFTADSVRCFGGQDGSAAVTATGGTLPYNFSWDNGDVGVSADSLFAALHFVTLTDANGCIAVANVVVEEPPLLEITGFDIQNIACFGDSSGALTCLPAGGVAPYTFVWDNGQNTQTAQNLVAGIYVVTVLDGNGCSGTRSAEVNQPPPLALTINQLTPITCFGACDGQVEVSIQGGTPAYSVEWSDPGIPPGSLAAQNLCAGAYTATATDAAGCADTLAFVLAEPDTMLLTIFAMPPACGGDSSGTAMVLLQGGSLPYEIIWSNGQTGLQTFNLPCGPLSVSVTDAQNCTVSATDSLPCVPALLIDSLRATDIRCFGEGNGELAVFTNGGQAPLVFLWSDPNQQSAPTAVNLLSGSYTVTVTDAFGCSRTATGSISEPTPISTSALAFDARCRGEASGQAVAKGMGGTPPYQFFWSNANVGDSISGLIAGVYLATVTDNNGCTALTPVVTISEPATTISLTVAETLASCFSLNNGSAQASASGSNGPPFQYQWSNGQTGPNATNLAPGAAGVTVSDALGCTASGSTDITEWDSIHVNIIFVKPSCFGYADAKAGINLVEGGAGMGNTSLYDYVWNLPGNPNTMLVDSLAGGQTYTVTVTDWQGCSREASVFVTQPGPIQLFTFTDSVQCAGLQNGRAGISQVMGDEPVVAYQWNNGDSTAVADSLMAGNYSVTVVDANGCRTDTLLSVFEPAPLSTNFSIKPVLCYSGKEASIQAMTSGGTPAYGFAWSNNVEEARLDGLPAGLYVLTVTDSKNCAAVDSVLLDEPPEPDISVAAFDPTCFEGKDGRIAVSAAGLAPPVRYSKDGSFYVGSSVFKGLSAGDHFLWVRDGNGCVYLDSVALDQPLPVEVHLGPDTTLVLGDSLLLIPDVSNAFAPVQFQWASTLVEPTTCLDSTCDILLVMPLLPNTYALTVTDANGCTGMDQLHVAVECKRTLYVPTAFSPNGDQQNDLLLVHGPNQGVAEITSFSVYDRWGEEVYADRGFLPNDPVRGWDGTFRGEPCLPGVYAWVIEVRYIDGQINTFTGSAMLLR